MHPTILHRDDLVHLTNTRKFEGYLFDETPVSFFLVDVVTGKGAGLHTHPYAEVHIAQDGVAEYTVGADKYRVTGGQVVIIPPEMPHGFVNIGAEPYRAVGIHPVAKMIQIDLE